MSGDAAAAVEKPLSESSSQMFDFVSLWKEIEKNCLEILQWCREEVSTQHATAVICANYTLVYHLVSHPCKNCPKVDPFNTSTSENVQQLKAVFFKLKDLLQNHLDGVARKEFSEGVTIEKYICLWRNYLIGIANLKTIFSPMTNALPASGFEMTPFDGAEDVAFEIWKECILTSRNSEELHEQFSSIVCEERTAGKAELSTVATEFKDQLTMLAEPDTYRRIVESAYKEGMNTYYESFCESMSTKYGKRAEKIDPVSYASACCNAIAEEAVIAAKYLQSDELLLYQLITRLVTSFSEEFTSAQLSQLICTDCNESCNDVSAIYAFLSQSPDKGLGLLEDIVQEFSCKEVLKVRTPDVRCPQDEAYRRFLIDVSAVIAKLALFFNTAFTTDDGNMVEAMEEGIAKAFAGLCVSVSFAAVAEHLADASDAILSADLTVGQLTIEDVVGIYYFLPEEHRNAKDAFLVHYQKLLCLRILRGDVDWKAERRALELLTEVKLHTVLFVCGKMLRAAQSESMYGREVTDLTLNAAVKPVVVSHCVWTSSSSLSAPLPAEFESAVDRARNECAADYAGRKLAFEPLLSTGVIIFRTSETNSRSVRLQLSFLQIQIVRLFDTHQKEWSATDIARKLQLSPELCANALEPLISAHVLEGGLQGVWVGDGSQLRGGKTVLNLVPRGTVQQVAAPIVAKKATSVNQMQHQERLSASIVQLLKREGAADFKSIQNQLSTAGIPALSVAHIKHCLEKLIERSMIARGENDIFQFLP